MIAVLHVLSLLCSATSLIPAFLSAIWNVSLLTDTKENATATAWRVVVRLKVSRKPHHLGIWSVSSSWDKQTYIMQTLTLDMWDVALTEWLWPQEGLCGKSRYLTLYDSYGYSKREIPVHYAFLCALAIPKENKWNEKNVAGEIQTRMGSQVNTGL